MQTLKDEVRERILQAATDDFLESGFSLASTRRIIRKAKISNGNLYNYFQSKEELFSAIAEPFCVYLKWFLANTFMDGDGEDFSDERTEYLSDKTGEMLDKYRREFIVVMDKSQGTRYEGFKAGIIDAVAEHFCRNVREEYKQAGEGEGFLMHVVATNIIEGLLGIAKFYKNSDWAKENVRLLFQYHSNGISRFY